MKHLAIYLKLFSKAIISVFALPIFLYASHVAPTYDTENFTELDEILKKYPMPKMESRSDNLEAIHRCDTCQYIVCQAEQGGYHVFGQTTVEDGYLMNSLNQYVLKYRTEFVDAHIKSLEDMQLESFGIKNCKNILIYNEKTKGFVFFHMHPGCLRHAKFPNFFVPTTEIGMLPSESLEAALPDLGNVEDLKCVIASFTAELIVDVVLNIEKMGITDIQVSCGRLLYEGNKIHTSASPVTCDIYGGGIVALGCDDKGPLFFDGSSSTPARDGKIVFTSARDGKTFVFRPGDQTFWHD